MKKTWIILGAAVALTSPAIAADMAAPPYTKAPPPVVAAVYNWSGFYVGGNAGAVFGRAPIELTTTNFTSPSLVNASGSPVLKGTGFTGGLQAGYNWQIGQALFGLESDINYTGFRRSQTGIFAPVAGLPSGYTISESTKSDWLWTLRPRIGVTVGNGLLYATGGLAVGNVSFTQSTLFPDCPSAGCPVTGTVSRTKTGWTVGGGWEQLLTNDWSVKVEYLYVDLGKISFSDNQGAFGFPQFSFVHQAKFQEQIARLGLNYHFNTPVVAKY
jgi:outer membrane immunogenic protein